jgi:hypothetical protein
MTMTPKYQPPRARHHQYPFVLMVFMTIARAITFHR